MVTEEQKRIVLHALRMASVASVDILVERTCLEGSALVAVLAELTQRGWATERVGRFSGWSLSASGRTEGERLLQLELDQAGARGAVESAYERFLDLNPTFLELCTRWQLVEVDGEETVNDHQDPVRDAEILGNLATVHELVLAISDDLSTALRRFGGYRARFEHAMSRLEANDVDWFTRPLIDSYHTVWFELHEDLLATLGRDRTSERPPGARTEGKS